MAGPRHPARPALSEVDGMPALQSQHARASGCLLISYVFISYAAGGCRISVSGSDFAHYGKFARGECGVTGSCVGERNARNLSAHDGWRAHVDSGASAWRRNAGFSGRCCIFCRPSFSDVGWARSTVEDLPHERRGESLATAIYEHESEGLLRFDGVLG